MVCTPGASLEARFGHPSHPTASFIVYGCFAPFLSLVRYAIERLPLVRPRQAGGFRFEPTHTPSSLELEAENWGRGRFVPRIYATAYANIFKEKSSIFCGLLAVGILY
jgi:hypothetical protein